MQLEEISFTNSRYPLLLREAKNPPSLLYARGAFDVNDRVIVAVVGTRHPDAYGIYVTKLYVDTLAKAGVIIVSGLAYGLDTAAHQAALDAGGTTIAVLGSGADRITPRANLGLAREILASGGAIISEQPPGTVAYAGNIVARNRIIAGMSHATFIAQAAENSGTLHTAYRAVDANRSVYVTPGNISNPRSRGSNDLLRTNAAHPTTSPLDILDELKPYFTATIVNQLAAVEESSLSNREEKILKLIEQHQNSIDVLLESSGLGPGELAETMSLLEITGRITNLGAGHWALKTRKPKRETT